MARKKISRHYVDLFAGQGSFRDEQGRIHDGSALRALTMGGPDAPGIVGFTDATLVNLYEVHHDALRSRVDALCAAGRSGLPRSRIQLLQADANEAIPAILSRIHRRAYVFVFADPESPNQLPWESVEALRAQGHESVDLYLLFPLDMALIRCTAWNPARLEPNAAALTRFFGTEDWRGLVAKRVTDKDRERLWKDLEALYMERLRAVGWNFVRRAREVRRKGDHRLYQMIFATNHPLADELAEWEGQEAQLPLI
jgi:three-Cys-motif partner protein